MASHKAKSEVWFITGTSSGLGLSVLKYVLSKGDIAIATLRNPEVLSDLAVKFSESQLLILKLDVSHAEEISSAFRSAYDKFGRIDVVYNNAGYGVMAEIEGTPNDLARDMFEVNFWGAANVSREAIRVFRDINKPVGGRLLQASSMGGISGTAALGYYSASKFALEGFSEALSKEVDPSWDIKIIILQLGGFRTKAMKLLTLPLHPSYTDAVSDASKIRNYFSGPMENIGNSDKAAREIYSIASDKLAPLHIPLGPDAISFLQEKNRTTTEVLTTVEKWSIDLK